MNVLPISLRDRQLLQVMRGHCTVLHRPRSPRLAQLARGDVLWIREPFCLERAADRFAPTAALAQGRPLAFTTDVMPGRDPWGNARAAGTLPRTAHRQHLVVAAVGLVPLAGIRAEELTAQGFASHDALLATATGHRRAFSERIAADHPFQAIRFYHHPTPFSEEE